MNALRTDLREGFFKLHLKRGEVPAMIEHRDGQWAGWIDGRRIARPDRDPVAAGVTRILHFGERICETEYARLMGRPIQVAA